MCGADLQSLRETDDSNLLVILVNQLQLIEHALSFLRNLADSLVIGVLSGLDLNAVNILIDDEAASIEEVLS